MTAQQQGEGRRGSWTEGPWAWFGNAGSNRLYLATTYGGRRYVMDFHRWGFNGAQPRFQADHRMVCASELVRFEVGDRDVLGVKQAKANASVYRLDIRGVDHPDARLIAAAPLLVEALMDAEAWLAPRPGTSAKGSVDDAIAKIRAALRAAGATP